MRTVIDLAPRQFRQRLAGEKRRPYGRELHPHANRLSPFGQLENFPSSRPGSQPGDAWLELPRLLRTQPEDERLTRRVTLAHLEVLE
jgi:hypothetical protein